MDKGTLVKDHICPSCGGVLKVDLDRQMYECPFCGVTFDYDYFREEAVLDLAKKAVTAGELESAKQAYEFMLTKEPDNFEALRGMALITMRTANVNSLAQMNRYSKMDSRKTFEAVDRAIEDSKPEHREYFEIMKGVVRSGKEYAKEEKLLEEEKTLKKRADSLQDNSRRLRDDINLSYNSDRKSSLPPVQAVVMALVFAVMWWMFAAALFANERENPYSKERYYTDTRTTSVYVYSGGNGQTINVGSGLSNGDLVRSARSLERANSASRAESQRNADQSRENARVEKYNEWERTHEDDDKLFGAMLFIPVVPLVCFGIWITKRQLGFNKEINELEEVILIHKKNIHDHEYKMDELKKKVNEDLMRMKKIDPLTT